VSLHDEHGDLLWLSESSMGPDEHNAVREAIEAFSNAGSPPLFVSDLGDSRSAVLLRAVNGRRAMVGAVMIVMDARVVKQDARGALKAMAPKLQRALADFAAMRPNGAARRRRLQKPPRPQPLTLVNEAPPAPATAARPAPAPKAPAVAPAATVAGAPGKVPAKAPAPRPRPCLGIGTSRRGRATLDGIRRQASARGDPGNGSPACRFAQHPDCTACSASDAVDQGQPAQTLRGTAAFQIRLVRRSPCDAEAAVENGLGSMIDRRVVTELIGYLVRHPDVWKSTAVMFSVNLTPTAIHDEHFLSSSDCAWRNRHCRRE